MADHIRYIAWFQHADFSAEELGELSPEEAVRIFAEFDLEAERALSDELERADKEHCPYGFGLNDKDGEWLVHLFVEDTRDQLFIARVEHYGRRMVLGVLPVPSTRGRELEGLSRQRCAEVIRQAYSNPEALFDPAG